MGLLSNVQRATAEVFLGLVISVSFCILDEGLLKENTDAVARGCANLEKHIENVGMFGVPCVVAVNKFTTDTPAETAGEEQDGK